MADQVTAATVEPMQPGRFLELLNKSPRTPEEEAALQAELLRQQHEKTQKEEAAKNAQNPAGEQPAADANAQNGELPAQQPAPAETASTTSVNATPAEPAAPAAPAQPAAPVDPGDYSLTQMSAEINDAISFLKTQEQTLAVEMASASLVQAKYWLDLASGN